MVKGSLTLVSTLPTNTKRTHTKEETHAHGTTTGSSRNDDEHASNAKRGEQKREYKTEKSTPIQSRYLSPPPLSDFNGIMQLTTPPAPSSQPLFVWFSFDLQGTVPCGRSGRVGFSFRHAFFICVLFPCLVDNAMNDVHTYMGHAVQALTPPRIIMCLCMCGCVLHKGMNEARSVYI